MVHVIHHGSDTDPIFFLNFDNLFIMEFFVWISSFLNIALAYYLPRGLSFGALLYFAPKAKYMHALSYPSLSPGR